MQTKQLNAQEVALRPHTYDETSKQYIPVLNPKDQPYPKYIYKEGRSRIVKDAAEFARFEKKGWANTPPKPVIERDPDEDDEDAAAVSGQYNADLGGDDLVPASSAPENAQTTEYPKTVYKLKKSRTVANDDELMRALKLGYSTQPITKKVA